MSPIILLYVKTINQHNYDKAQAPKLSLPHFKHAESERRFTFQYNDSSDI